VREAFEHRRVLVPERAALARLPLVEIGRSADGEALEKVAGVCVRRLAQVS